MKLTTQRLKQLIREELNNVKEAIRIPGHTPGLTRHDDDSLGYKPKDLKIDENNAIKEAVAKVMVLHGMEQQEADEMSARVATEMMRPASGYALNTKKSSNPRHSRQPEGQREEYFMIIANMLKETGMEEQKKAAIAEEASYEAIRALRNLAGAPGLRFPFAHTPSARMQRD